jgi:mannose-6-phosphate isomerase-like protein (cupin superfamily)
MDAGAPYEGAKMERPIVTRVGAKQAEDRLTLAAVGQSLVIHEWSGSGPDYLHVHYDDDEAWHVLEGSLTFRFEDRQLEAPAGTTVFVPAGVPHTYSEDRGPTRYLIIMTPRLHERCTRHRLNSTRRSCAGLSQK